MGVYEDFINKPNSSKTVLFEISKGLPFTQQVWIRHSPNVWKTTYSWEQLQFDNTKYGIGYYAAGEYGKASSGILPKANRDTANIITDLFVNNEKYSFVVSPEEVAINPQTMTFIPATQELFINYPGYIRAQSIIVSVQFGYSNKALRFNDIYYEPRLNNLPKLSFTRDGLFNKIIKFGGGSVILENEDGALDGFEDADIYGQSVKIRYGGDDLAYEDFEEIFTGYLEQWDFVKNTLRIDIKDERKNLQNPIPTNSFTLTDYPNLKKNNNGKPIPIGYGKITKGKAICTNEEELLTPTYSFSIDTTSGSVDYSTFAPVSPSTNETMFIENIGTDGNKVTNLPDEASDISDGKSNLFKYDGATWKQDKNALVPLTYHFKFVDVDNHYIDNIDEVYVNDVAVVFQNGSTTLGTFDLSSDDYKKGQKVAVDFIGYIDLEGNVIDNPYSIIEDLLLNYAGIAYTESSYNQEEWQILKEASTIKTSLFVSQTSELIKHIVGFAKSAQGSFVVEGDGKFNMKIIDLEKDIVGFIKLSEQYSNEPEKRNLFNEYASSAKVLYNKDYTNDEHSEYTDKNKEVDLRNNFRRLKEQTFETYLSEESDAIQYGTDMMDIYGGVFKQYTVNTFMKYSNLELEDMVAIEINEDNDGIIRNEICEVIGKSLDLIGNTVILTVRGTGRSVVPEDVASDTAVYGTSVYGNNIYGS